MFGSAGPMPPRRAQSAAAGVAVVVVNYRTPQLTIDCLAALRGERQSLPGLRAIVVDGGSGDESAGVLAEAIGRPEYKGWASFVPLQINGGFGWANNQAILTLALDRQPPEFIHLLNPDTRVMAGAVTKLVQDLRGHPRCGAAGSQLVDGDGRPSASAFYFPSAGLELVNGSQSEKLGRIFGVERAPALANEAREVDWVTGASVMFRMAALRDTGLFDDGFFLYFDEVELMHRLRRHGWTVRHVPESRVVHLEGASTGLGESASVSRLPAYWYRSRRRYFTLTGGRASVVGADLALLAGRFIAILKALISPGFRSRAAGLDLLRFGFWPRRRDRHPSAPKLGDRPGAPPSWMRQR